MEKMTGMCDNINFFLLWNAGKAVLSVVSPPRFLPELDIVTVTPHALVHTGRAFHAFLCFMFVSGKPIFSAEILFASGEGTALVRYGKAKHAFNREQSLFSTQILSGNGTQL